MNKRFISSWIQERVCEKKGSEERIEEENEDVDGDDNCVEKREP